MVVNWLGGCGDHLADWNDDQLAGKEWQSIGWASVAINWSAGNGDQLAGQEWRSIG